MSEIQREAYEMLAQVYNELMDDVPYDAWAKYIQALFTAHGICDGLVLDLGCGTGNITGRLSAMGFDMIGVDSSEQMLTEAEKAYPELLFLQQDMQELELYGTVAAAISTCDCINYITEPQELVKVFRLVNNYLDAGGLFYFDFNTVYKYQEVIGDRVIAENREDCSFIWENTYYEEERINEYCLTLFTAADGSDTLFTRQQEIHVQRAYTLEEIKDLLAKAGMEFLFAKKAYCDEPCDKRCERIGVLCREARQEGKYYE